MKTELYAHRYADIILNSDIAIKNDIENTIRKITFSDAAKKYNIDNILKKQRGKNTSKGKQSTLNLMFKDEFSKLGWDIEKSVFTGSDNDLIIDFWKRDIGLDVAFNHRSFIGGDLLRFQAAAEVKNLIKIGVYICPTKAFAKIVSPDGASMVTFERTKWYLETLYPVITVPIWLIGLND